MCIEFIRGGFFQLMTLQLFRVTPSIEEWIKPGKEKCKLVSELIIQQLRFWKVCVAYGYCISSFTSFFPSLCLWLTPPTFDKLVETNLFDEFSSITMEVYLVLETLARTLPNLHSNDDQNQEFKGSFGVDFETWCWNDVGPMIDMALKWLELMQNRVIDNFVNPNHVSSLLWVLSSVMEMLNTILVKVTPNDSLEFEGSQSGRKFPDFVAKVLLQFLQNGILGISRENKDGSFVEKLCQFRHQSDSEVSISSVCCLRGILRFIVSCDKLVQLTDFNLEHKSVHGYDELIRDNKILHGNIFKYSLNEWRKVIGVYVKFITSEWKSMHSLEVFGRGGPAPGVGAGWGVLGGGFWSLTMTLVQGDARLLIELLRIFYSSSSSGFTEVKEDSFMVESINSALSMCLVVGPGDGLIIQNVFDILLGIPVLNFLDQCIFHFLKSCESIEPFTLEYKESDCIQFGKILASHFQNRWLSIKKKKNPEIKAGSNQSIKMGKVSPNLLDTIPEDMETSISNGENGDSLMVEWARQRLPLPIYWFLSPITTISEIQTSNTSKSTGIPNIQNPIEYYEVSKAGLFLLLGLEAMSSNLQDKVNSPIKNIPLIWKLHALSMPLLVGMGVLEEEKSRYMYEALQRVYTRNLNELWLNCKGTNSFGVGCLRFQCEINENYSTFIEHLVEQFAAISYGDVIFGRQIAIYLHRLVDASIRLTTWNVLSNAHALELLPPLFDCLSVVEGYLEPSEVFTTPLSLFSSPISVLCIIQYILFILS